MAVAPEPFPAQPSLLGLEQSRFLPADPTAFTIEGLRAGITYTVGVSAIVDGREGSPVTATGRIGEVSPTLQCQLVPLALGPGDSCPLGVTAPEQVGTVSQLEVQASRSNIARVTWVGVPGATAYRVVWSRRDGTVGQGWGWAVRVAGWGTDTTVLGRGLGEQPAGSWPH